MYAARVQAQHSAGGIEQQRRRARGARAAVALACGLFALQCGHVRIAAAQAGECLAAHAQGQRLRIEGALVAARGQLLRCAQSDCPALVSGECTTWLAEVDAAVSTVVFAVTDPRGNDLVDVRVRSDDVAISERTDGRALPIDPGVHRFEFEAGGYQAHAITLAVRQSERNRIVRVQLEPITPAPTPMVAGGARPMAPQSNADIAPATYALGGVALAGLLTFGYFALDGAARYDEAERSCAPSCTRQQVAAGKRAYVIADIGLGVGLAGAAAAVIVQLTARPQTELDPRPRVEPIVQHGGAQLRWRGRF